MTGERGDPRGHQMGRPWLLAGLCFAVAATAVLVLSDDARWLRLGIVAALWAALLGAFLAASYRRQADQTQESMGEAQAIYELELEREIAARREYELEIETEARRGIEAKSRQELDALRSEVTALRESLQQLFGAEVLYERVALTAQSTRMRSIHEGQGALSARDPRADRPPRILTGPSIAARDDLAEQRTELIARVLGSEPPPKREPSKPNGELPSLSWFAQEPQEEPRSANGSGVPETSDPSDSGDLSSALGGQYDLEWKPSWAEPADIDRYEETTSPPEPAVNGHREAPEEPPARHNANSTLPELAREIQRQGRPGGRRRKPEPEEQEAAPPAATGRHSRRGAVPEPLPEPLPEPPPEPVAPSGSHAHGRSVSDLLAAYGTEEEPRRRHRRD